MSEENVGNETEVQIPSELDSLKERARIMGIAFSPNIGVDTLRARVNAKLNGEDAPDESETPPVTEDEPPAKAEGPPEVKPAPTSTSPKAKTKSIAQLKLELQTRQRNDARKLVRVVVQCMNPNKKDWTGEIFTVSNAVVGTIKKFVPFGVEAGYHVPHMIYEMIKNRKYQHFTKKKLANGQSHVESKISPEFNIRLLNALTMEEMKELHERQALNHSID
jgi:hypothetical protein